MTRVIPAVVRQHAEDATFIHVIRTSILEGPHVKLRDLARFDERIAAHIDGLLIAGPRALPLLEAALESPTPSALFPACSLAIEGRSEDRLNRYYALAEAMPEVLPGLISAFGWAPHERLRGLVSSLLNSENRFRRLIGLAACAVQRVDARAALTAALEGSTPALNARALRSCGELGRTDLMPRCLRFLDSSDPETAFWAAWASVLLGNRGAALDALKEIGEVAGPFQARALRLTIQAMSSHGAHACLRQLALDAENKRWLIRGSGIAGDPTYAPWLIQHMRNPAVAPLAGEAFTLITGLDLTRLEYQCRPAEGEGAAKSDDRADEDAALPQPDAERVASWWEANRASFTPGVHYFVGAPLSREHCLQVLKRGFQRQRILAAYHLCLLEPGTPLFEWRAPAPRQQRLLASMG